MTSRYKTGSTIIKLTEPAQRFYFYSVGEHCEVGQKLAINVLLVAPPLDTDVDNSGATQLLGLAGARLTTTCVCLMFALLTMAV
jgi:hypothetical protein